MCSPFFRPLLLFICVAWFCFCPSFHLIFSICRSMTARKCEKKMLNKLLNSLDDGEISMFMYLVVWYIYWKLTVEEHFFVVWILYSTFKHFLNTKNMPASNYRQQMNAYIFQPDLSIWTPPNQDLLPPEMIIVTSPKSRDLGFDFWKGLWTWT